jgi:iron complex transport system substrate-binding protein
LKSIHLAIAAVAVAAIVIAAGALAASASPDRGGSGPVTLVDGRGETVTVSSSDRVATIGSVVTEIAFGLGASSKLAGVTTDDGIYDSDELILGMPDDGFPGDAKKMLADGRLVALGGMYNISAESILKCSPDLVLMGGYFYSDATIKRLGDMGIPVVVGKDDNSLDNIYFNIAMYGKALGRDGAAGEMVAGMKSAIGRIVGWTESLGAPSPRVGTFMGIGSEWGTYACGVKYLPGSPMIEMLGGTNAFAAGIPEMYAVVSKESIASAAPEVMIDVTPMTQADLDALKGDPVLRDVPAVKNGRVYACFDPCSNAATITSQGFVNAAALMAMFMYEDRLSFELDHSLGEGYAEYLREFWAQIGA